MLRGRGERISFYLEDSSPEGKACWDAAEEFIYPVGHPKAGSIQWSTFARYIASLVLADRQRKGLVSGNESLASEQPDLRREISELRSQVATLTHLIRSGAGSGQLAAAVSDSAENPLTDKALSMAEDSWS